MEISIGSIRARNISLVFLLALSCCVAFADDAKSSTDAKGGNDTASPAADGSNKSEASAQGGIGSVLSNLGVGLAVFALDKEDIVSATIEQGVVRVTEKRKMRAGPWLQTQWTCDKCWPSKDWVKPGLFLGAEILGGDELIRTVGIGLNLQFLRSDKSRQPINLGIGAHWTTIQVLGNGLTEDQPVPTGIEAIRYRKETQPGFLIAVAFGF